MRREGREDEGDDGEDDEQEDGPWGGAAPWAAPLQEVGSQIIVPGSSCPGPHGGGVEVLKAAESAAFCILTPSVANTRIGSICVGSDLACCMTFLFSVFALSPSQPTPPVLNGHTENTRQDVVSDGDIKEKVLGAAQRSEDGFFTAPRVVEK